MSIADKDQAAIAATTGTAGRAPDAWSVDDAEDYYRVAAWGDGFFRVGVNGRMAVHPFGDDALSIDILDVVEELRERKVRFPALVRFQDVLRARVKRLNQAFIGAIEEANYEGSYRAIYPIKVNQLHEVVEEVLDAGKPFGLGLECGSKAELVATVAHLESDETLLICNGVKDRSMISLILSSQRLQKNVIPVMEKYGEFEELMTLAADMDIETQFGVRIRLRTSGAGRWADSGGYQSKFGVSLPELMQIVDTLKISGSEKQLKLLHFHLGSQISEITQLKQAARELAHIYAELAGLGLEIRYIDVGGGLGVNYSDAAEEGSIHYSLQEYANAVVNAIKDVCDARDLRHPILLSESGRAMTAHHSVLVVEALGAYRKDSAKGSFDIPADANRNTHSLQETLCWLRDEQPDGRSVEQLVEAYHDVIENHTEAATLFSLGYLSLKENALVERIYWSCCASILDQILESDPDPVPPEVTELEELLVDQYLVDFSVFQSMLDHWAIEQPFPIVPLGRLNERPSRRAMIVDLTCDSDGKIATYVSSSEDKKYLQLHALEPDETYRIGIFLMGAYQDIMGDAHNLFGRVTEAHVYGDAEEDGNFWIEKVIPGATVKEMLADVQYFPNDLQRRMQDQVRQKIDAGVIRPKRGIAILDQYRACFDEGTYFDNQSPESKGNE